MPLRQPSGLTPEKVRFYRHLKAVEELIRAVLVYADEPDKGSGVFLRRAVERYRKAVGE